MTPTLSNLVSAADAAKQNLVILVNQNESAAKLAEQATQRHKECFEQVVSATDELQKARAAVDAELDTEYGVASPVVADTPEPTPVAPEPTPVAPDVVPEVITDAPATEVTS
jgi:hypothetical protein